MLIPTMSQMARAERSAKLLRSQGARRYGDGLFVEDDERVRPRAPDEVAARARIVWTLARAADRLLSIPEAGEALECAGLQPALTPLERRFLAGSEPTPEARVRFAWGRESAVALLWGLSSLARMGWPEKVRPDVDIAEGVGALDAMSAPTLRPTAELLDAQDLFLRLHWIVRDAASQGKPLPFPLVADVVRERHLALNWLLKARDQDWDDRSPGPFSNSRS